MLGPAAPCLSTKIKMALRQIQNQSPPGRPFSAASRVPSTTLATLQVLVRKSGVGHLQHKSLLQFTLLSKGEPVAAALYHWLQMTMNCTLQVLKAAVSSQGPKASGGIKGIGRQQGSEGPLAGHHLGIEALRRHRPTLLRKL